MHKKFEINLTKIKGGCQSGRKVVTHNSKNDLLLAPALEQIVLTVLFSYYIGYSFKYLVVYLALSGS